MDLRRGPRARPRTPPTRRSRISSSRSTASRSTGSPAGRGRRPRRSRSPEGPSASGAWSSRSGSTARAPIASSPGKNGRLALECGERAGLRRRVLAGPARTTASDTSDGVPIVEVAPSIEWGYLLYLTVFRVCQYFGKDEECRFCDINDNFRQQRAGRQPVLHREAGRARAGRAAQGRRVGRAGRGVHADRREHHDADRRPRRGVVLRPVRRSDRARVPAEWIGKMVVQALPACRPASASRRRGHPDLPPELRDLGREALRADLPRARRGTSGATSGSRRIVDAVPIFGPWRVIPNFVAGIELARPYGFDSVEEALRSTGEGLDWFMSRGVIPRFTTWCPEPLSDLGATNGPAPLEYHAALLRRGATGTAPTARRRPPATGRPASAAPSSASRRSWT